MARFAVSYEYRETGTDKAVPGVVVWTAAHVGLAIDWTAQMLQADAMVVSYTITDQKAA